MLVKQTIAKFENQLMVKLLNIGFPPGTLDFPTNENLMVLEKPQMKWP